MIYTHALNRDESAQAARSTGKVRSCPMRGIFTLWPDLAIIRTRRPGTSNMAITRRTMLLAGLACLAAHAFAQDKGGPIRSVDIAESADGYVATMVMQAPVPPKIAWDVLTDFDNMEKWVPNVRESRIVNHNGNDLTIEQKGTAKFGVLSIPYTSVRKMQLEPEKSILATQVQGSMRKLVSLMRVSADGTATRLDYRLEIVPSAIAASVMSKDFLRGELTDQFTAIVGEMVRRAK